jgi:hypothetical protein|tara:strand:- start:1138 stop:1455 length:318 start_codon:yes stop_codon:yes gene_type:complete
MKVSKNQLRKIIQEERARLLKEQLTDATAWQGFLEGLAVQVSDRFGNDMLELFDEDPEMFAGRSTREEWENQVQNAQLELDTGLVTAMEEKIAEIETMLHDGQYS